MNQRDYNVPILLKLAKTRPRWLIGTQAGPICPYLNQKGPTWLRGIPRNQVKSKWLKGTANWSIWFKVNSKCLGWVETTWMVISCVKIDTNYDKGIKSTQLLKLLNYLQKVSQCGPIKLQMFNNFSVCLKVHLEGKHLTTRDSK